MSAFRNYLWDRLLQHACHHAAQNLQIVCPKKIFAEDLNWLDFAFVPDMVDQSRYDLGVVSAFRQFARSPAMLGSANSFSDRRTCGISGVVTCRPRPLLHLLRVCAGPTPDRCISQTMRRRRMQVSFHSK